MNKFLGTLLRYGGSNGTKMHLTDEQVAWLVRWFPVTENRRIAEAMGCCVERLRGFARSLGLEKSEKGMKAINARRVKKAVRSNERNGCYDRKRGHPCSEATLSGVARRWREEREGLRENAILKMRRERPDAYAAMLEKRSRERRESIRREKLRILYGLERKTRLKVAVMTPYTQSQTHRRCSALKRGYLLDYDCSEGTEGRYMIYWDDQTQRSEKFERNCIADGFTFARDE